MPQEYKKNNIDELNSIIDRLVNENTRWRMKFEEIEKILRLKKPEYDGMSLEAVIKTIIQKNDEYVNKISKYKKEIRKTFHLVANDKIEEAKKFINSLLFENK